MELRAFGAEEESFSYWSIAVVCVAIKLATAPMVG